MNKGKKWGKINTLQTWIPLMFLILAMILPGLLFSYWVVILEPQLRVKAEITARALAQSRIHVLAYILESVQEDKKAQEIVKEIGRALDTILLLKDPNTKAPFILGIEVDVDYDVVKAEHGTLDLSAGSRKNACHFITEIPLYSRNTRELLGIAKVYNSCEFFDQFKKDIKLSFFIGAGICFLLLILAWRIVAALQSKIHSGEKRLMEKQTQIVHAGRLSAMGEMATGIAHEINQPLAIIRIAADGLNSYFLKKDEDSMEAKAAKKIIFQVNRAAKIIDNMRSFMRPGSDIIEQIDLVEPLNIALSFFKEQFRINRILLTISISKDHLMARINPQKFEQIVVNFLSNARFAVEEKQGRIKDVYQKEVMIHLFDKPAEGTVILEVKDNGIGMREEVLNRCLEPFYTTKEVGKGTGLGLSIVNSIVQEARMRMEIDSSLGKGTCFRIIMKQR